jgi:hypothetical protein
MLRRILYKMSVAITVLWALSLLPSPTEALPLGIKNGLLGIAGVLYFGKVLYDTLFFDHYRP